jgi:hypothetical protein
VSRGVISISYARSLLWAALFIAVTCCVANIIELLSIDFIHGNPHRTRENAIFMMMLFQPIFGFVAIVGSLIVFSLPQFFQAVLLHFLVQMLGNKARFLVLLALPLTAVLTWYCYDYFTPSDVHLSADDSPDSSPYQHGLTIWRYLAILAIQVPMTLFSFLYFDAAFRCRSKRPVLLVALAAAIIAGGIWGYVGVEGQFRFL